MRRSYETRLGDMGQTAREVGLARSDEVVTARVCNAGGEDDLGWQVHLVGDGTGKHGVRLEQRRLVLEAKDAGRIVEIKQGPKAPVDATGLAGFDAVVNEKPASIRPDGRAASADFQARA